jgi:hypothetical protein
VYVWRAPPGPFPQPQCEGKHYEFERAWPDVNCYTTTPVQGNKRATYKFFIHFLFRHLKPHLRNQYGPHSMTFSSPQDEFDYTLAQHVAITFVPAFSGTLSFMGSSCIVRVKYRILFALCLCDLINSPVFVFSCLPIPQRTPGEWGAMGHKASCNAQFCFCTFWDYRELLQCRSGFESL